MSDIRLQAALGNLENSGRPDLNMNGYTCLARIIKIHHKRNTADVRLVRSNDVIMSVSQNEGKFSCKIGTSYAHFDPKINKSSGVIEPLHEGQLVVVGYLENLKNEPWILAALHWTMDASQNILPDRYPIDSSDLKEYAKYLRVFPSQDYFRVDREGNIEFALHGKSFLKIDDNATDAHDGTDFEDLSEKDKFTHTTRTMEDAQYHKPKGMLFVHRDNWNDKSANRTKIFISPEGMLRASRDNNDNKLTFSELHNDGSLRLKRQLDSNVFDTGQNSIEAKVSEAGAFSVSKNSARGNVRTTINFSLNEHSELRITRTVSTPIDYVTTELSLDSANGINISTRNPEEETLDIQCSADGTIKVYGKNGITLSTEFNSFRV